MARCLVGPTKTAERMHFKINASNDEEKRNRRASVKHRLVFDSAPASQDNPRLNERDSTRLGMAGKKTNVQQNAKKMYYMLEESENSSEDEVFQKGLKNVKRRLIFDDEPSVEPEDRRE